MSNIEEAGNQAAKFVKEGLSLAEAHLIRAVRGEGGWEVEVEVYEDSAFIKSLGLHTRVRDRNIYLVSLDDQMNVQSYQRKAHAA